MDGRLLKACQLLMEFAAAQLEQVAEDREQGSEDRGGRRMTGDGKSGNENENKTRTSGAAAPNRESKIIFPFSNS